jgi:hypothetical protein
MDHARVVGWQLVELIADCVREQGSDVSNNMCPT